MVMYCESSMQDFLHILPWKIYQAMAIICFFAILRNKNLWGGIKLSEPIWIKGMEDKMHELKFYEDTSFELVEEKTA